MKKQTLSEQLTILIIGIGGFYFAIVLFSDISAVVDEIHKINFFYIPLILFFIFIQIIFLGFKFHRLLKALNINLPLKDSIKIFVAGLSLIVTPGGMGTAIKSHILKKKYNIPISSTLPIVLVERITELIGVIVLLAFFLLFVNSYESLLTLGFASGLLIVLLMLVSNSKIFSSVKKIVTRINFIKKFSDSFDESQESYIQLLNRKTFSETLGWSILAKTCQFLSVYFIFISLDIDMTWYAIGELLHTSIILGIVSFLPTGIIVIESSMIALLVKNNIEFSLATLTIIIFRIVTTWVPMGAGLVALKKSEYKTIDSENSE